MCIRDRDAGVTYGTSLATGKIGGKAFTANTASVEGDYWDSSKYDFDFYGTVKADPCAYIGLDSFQVMFILPKKTGTYPISFNLFNTENNRTVTFFVLEGNMNNIAIKGNIEIISIDSTVANEVKGRLNVTCDAANFLNGTFTAKLCK